MGHIHNHSPLHIDRLETILELVTLFDKALLRPRFIAAPASVTFRIRGVTILLPSGYRPHPVLRRLSLSTPCQHSSFE